ncbi:MAG: beta-lactamase family protein [Sphingopyxis sp.]|nr:beta-lactamase family protein [Sphingopyxis sp.]
MRYLTLTPIFAFCAVLASLGSESIRAQATPPAVAISEANAAMPAAAILISFDRTGAQQTRVLRGLADRSSGRALTADDPVRIASVSKLTVALGVMRLADQRRINLDADVSTYLGWRLRHPRYPNRVITLAMLLSHRAGMADGISYGLPLDGDLEAALRDPAAWDADRAPGGAFAYANINFPVVAAAMEGATGERFDRLMHRLVFAPLRIDACFNWVTCSDAAVARHVVLYRPTQLVARDDLGGARPACPVAPASDGSCDLSQYRLARNGSSFGPQGSLRISARGLATIGEMLLRGGDRFLTPRSFRRLTQMQPVAPLRSVSVGEGGEGEFFCRYGLAMQQLATPRSGCRDDPVGDGRMRIGHAGDAYSLLSGLWVDMERGTGMAYFLTESPEIGAPPGTRSAFRASEEALIAEAGVRDPRPVRRR